MMNDRVPFSANDTDNKRKDIIYDLLSLINNGNGFRIPASSRLFPDATVQAPLPFSGPVFTLIGS